MILLTGDSHGHIDIEKFTSDRFPIGHDYMGKNDYIIVLGDFGLLWDNSDKEKYWRKWLNGKPWTTLFLDGNHENFDMINELPLVTKFGGMVGKVNDSIYHLRRGEIYTIENKKFFVFGGATSIDKANRMVGISWWPEEIPDYTEMKKGLDNLERHGYCVDYILTHTCPERIFEQFTFERIGDDVDPTRKFLDEVDKKTNFDRWFFAHFHDDLEFESDKYIMLYDVIRGLE